MKDYVFSKLLFFGSTLVLTVNVQAHVTSASQSILTTLKNPLCWEAVCPVSKQIKQPLFIDHGLFVLNYNRETKFADWVAYVVDKKNLHGPKRKRVWRRDPQLPKTLALYPKDYRGAYKAYHYDRGHQAPLASFSQHSDWEKANYLSNITPQKAALNRGAWKRLEMAIRKLAEKRKLYVVTGPLYDGKSLPQLPQAHLTHHVPTGYWKLVLYPVGPHVACVSAFTFKQTTPQRDKYCQHKINLHNLEAKLPYRLLSPHSRVVAMGQVICPVTLC